MRVARLVWRLYQLSTIYAEWYVVLVGFSSNLTIEL